MNIKCDCGELNGVHAHDCECAVPAAVDYFTSPIYPWIIGQAIDHGYVIAVEVQRLQVENAKLEEIIEKQRKLLDMAIDELTRLQNIVCNDDCESIQKVIDASNEMESE
jgi:hypothetical protein